MSDLSVSDDPKDWGVLLGSVSARNRGRFVTMQVTGVLAAHADHFILRDLSYDSVDRCIEIRVADTADGRCGITRTIGHPTSVVVYRGADGRERALEVVQDRGTTLIQFQSDVTRCSERLTSACRPLRQSGIRRMTRKGVSLKIVSVS
jgi:hypothetical protein